MKIILTIFVVLLLSACVWLVGCASVDPVKGWNGHNANLDPPNLTNYFSGKIYYVDEAILDDYPKFIEQLKKKYPHLYVSEVDFYEDGTGQHAIKLTIETEMRDYREYYLMYDKSNVRTKVIKGSTSHQFHM
jgi:hypothetical protein